RRRRGRFGRHQRRPRARRGLRAGRAPRGRGAHRRPPAAGPGALARRGPSRRAGRVAGVAGPEPLPATGPTAQAAAGGMPAEVEPRRLARRALQVILLLGLLLLVALLAPGLGSVRDRLAGASPGWIGV